MKELRIKKYLILDIVGVLFSIIIFGVPFYFVLLNSFKDRRSAGLLNLKWPESFHAVENYMEVLTFQNHIVIRSFFNSVVVTVLSVLLLIITCSMAGYVLQRRRGKSITFLNFLFLAGLMLPPSILPTIWVMQGLNIYKSLFGMSLVEVTINASFTIILYRGFISSIPIEIEEAGYIDGCGKLRLFAQIIFPLLLPVTATVIVLNAVAVFNDFVNPLYFLPGTNNATIQLTLYNFMGKFSSSWNLLFADVVLIMVPMLILFIIFNKQIIAGMCAGSVKG